MGPARIVFCHYDFPTDVGGVSTWLQALLPDLRRRGLDVRVHVSNSDAKTPGPNIRHFLDAGVPVRWAKPAPSMRERVRQCVEWLNLDQPTVYVPSCLVEGLYTAGYVRSQGLATVGVLHSDDPFYAAITEEFIAADTASRFSSVVAVSEYLAGQVKNLGIDSMPCACIPYGVSIPEQTARFDGGRFTLVYVGRMVEEQKQVSAVARAFCEAARRNPQVQAVMIGDGPARPSVAAIVAESGVGDRVRLLNRMGNDEVIAFLRTAQAVVLLSDYEGLPVALLEGMASGLVPICLNIRSGVGEVVRDGQNGFLVQDREEDFQTCVARLASDRGLWMRCSAAARATVERSFSRPTCHAKWVTVLEEASQRAPAPRYPIAAPQRVPTPHAAFRWFEPDLIDRLIPAIAPLRDRVGLWRRRWTGRSAPGGA